MIGLDWTGPKGLIDPQINSVRSRHYLSFPLSLSCAPFVIIFKFPNMVEESEMNYLFQLLLFSFLLFFLNVLCISYQLSPSGKEIGGNYPTFAQAK